MGSSLCILTWVGQRGAHRDLAPQSVPAGTFGSTHFLNIEITVFPTVAPETEDRSQHLPSRGSKVRRSRGGRSRAGCIAQLPACRLGHRHPAEASAMTLAMAAVLKTTPSRPGPSSLGGKLNSGELSLRCGSSARAGDSGRSSSRWDGVQLGCIAAAVPVLGTTLPNAAATPATAMCGHRLT